MANSELGRKIRLGLVAFWGLAILFGFIFSLVRQVIAQRWIGRSLARKRLELNYLEEQNRNLLQKLKETEGPGFLEQQAAVLLGMTKAGEPITVVPEEEKEEEPIILPPEIPNYQKWLKLFWY